MGSFPEMYNDPLGGSMAKCLLDSRVRVLLWPLAGFKFSATLENNQLSPVSWGF